MFPCVCVSAKHEGIFAQALAGVHGDVMEKGRNVTDRVGQETEEEEEEEFFIASFLYSSLLLCLFAGEKREP